MTPYYDRDGITIYCGDCLEIMPLLDVTVDAVICDPPYGISYQSSRRIDKKSRKNKIANDHKPFVGWGEITHKITKVDGCILIFYRWDVQEPFREELSNNNWMVKSQVIWDKESHSMGDLVGEYAPQHESILFARKNGFKFLNGRPKSIIRCAKIPPEKLRHPNEKPEPLLNILIGQVTSPNEIILDFTMGSGTTLVAARNLGRRAIGIEIDESYCKIATERLRQPSFFSIPNQQPSRPEYKQQPLIGGAS